MLDLVVVAAAVVVEVTLLSLDPLALLVILAFCLVVVHTFPLAEVVVAV